MMRPFAPSAATASDATASGATTSGSQSKNNRCYLKLILRCFLPIYHIPNRTKNIVVKMTSYGSARAVDSSSGPQEKSDGGVPLRIT